jgi:hypothetical protein
MKRPAAVTRTEPVKVRPNRNVYFMSRHWDALQKYHDDLSMEISALEKDRDALQSRAAAVTGILPSMATLSCATKLPGIRTEIELKQRKLSALELLQAVSSYQELQVVLTRTHLEKGVRSGKRFNDILLALEVFAYHDDLDIFDDKQYQYFLIPYLSFREAGEQSRKTDAAELSHYFDEAEKASIIKVRDDLQCAVNEFDHKLYLKDINKKFPKLTTSFLKGRAFKRMQICALNELLLDVHSRETCEEYINKIIYRFQNLNYALGDFSGTPCVGLLDQLLKHKGFYFSFKDYYEIHQLRTDLNKSLDDLQVNHTPAWLGVTSDTYKAEWIAEEMRIKTIKLQTLDNLLKIDDLVALQRFVLNARSDPDALKGNPSRVKQLLESLEQRHLQNAIEDNSARSRQQGVARYGVLPSVMATRYQKARDEWQATHPITNGLN